MRHNLLDLQCSVAGLACFVRNSAEERAQLDVVSLCAKPIVVVVVITYGFW